MYIENYFSSNIRLAKFGRIDCRRPVFHSTDLNTSLGCSSDSFSTKKWLQMRRRIENIGSNNVLGRDAHLSLFLALFSDWTNLKYKCIEYNYHDNAYNLFWMVRWEVRRNMRALFTDNSIDLFRLSFASILQTPDNYYCTNNQVKITCEVALPQR